MTNTINERGAIITDPMGIKRIIKENYEQLYAHKFAILDNKMNQFLEKHNLLKLTHVEINNLIRPICVKAIDSVIFETENTWPR